MQPLLFLTARIGTTARRAAPAAGGRGPAHTVRPAHLAQMSMSTIIMPCNTSGYFDAAFAAQYGIAVRCAAIVSPARQPAPLTLNLSLPPPPLRYQDIDWSNGRKQWAMAKPMDDDARLATQAAAIKAINPATHVWIYRNLVKALSWYGAVREKLEDPAFSGWFLHFNNPDPTNYSVPRGNTTLYHSQDQTPTTAECGAGGCDCGKVPCGEYLWDPRNASLRSWLINEHILGPTGLGNPNVSGFYFDDCWNCESYTLIPTDRRLAGWDTAPTKPNGTKLIGQYGPSEIEHHSITDMGLSFAEDMEIANAWQSLMTDVYAAIADAGGWGWPLNGGDTVRRLTCAADLRAACKQENGPLAYMFTKGDNGPSNLTQPVTDLANFLLVRGAHKHKTKQNRIHPFEMIESDFAKTLVDDVALTVKRQQ